MHRTSWKAFIITKRVSRLQDKTMSEVNDRLEESQQAWVIALVLVVLFLLSGMVSCFNTSLEQQKIRETQQEVELLIESYERGY
jgi:flagellar basal body-associated protein FliL